MSYPAYQAVDEVPIRQRTGQGAYGPVWADSVTVRCKRTEGERIIRNEDGDDLYATTQLEIPAYTDVPDGLFATNGTVHIGDRETTVIKSAETRRRGQLIYTTIYLA